MKYYLKNWTVMRSIRLIIGLSITFQGFQASDWLFVTLGGLFSIMPLLNIGCGSSGCGIPSIKPSGKSGNINCDEIR